MSYQAPRQPRRSMLVIRSVALGLALLARAATAQEPAHTEEERVTAVDVFVEVGPAADSPGKAPPLRRGLGAADFEIRLGGRELPVIGFSDPREDSGSDPELWSIVVYFDLSLAERETVRWAASELAARAGELVELGQVEIVVAEEAPIRLLGATRDVGLIRDQLAGVALDPEGEHSVIESRAEALDAMRGLEPGPTLEQVAAAVVSAEAATVVRRLDELVSYVVASRVAGSKRALVWITDGFDLDPSRFFREVLADTDVQEVSLESHVRETASVLAGYGWVTFSLAPTPPDAGLVPGFRIGKWLYRPRMPTGLIGGMVTREERRDPDKAEAYIELGESHLGGDDPGAAKEAFEKALYHFAGDPRTSNRQAAAKAGLGRALAAQGRDQNARLAFRHAVELDPSLAAEYTQSRPRLLAPIPALDIVARETAGRTIREVDDVDEALASLDRRARLTYQVAGSPRGALQALAIAPRDRDGDLSYARWSRSGTPKAIAGARARSLASGGILEGDLSVEAALEMDPAGESAVLVRIGESISGVPEAGEPERTRRVRVSVAFGLPDALLEVRHALVEIVEGSEVRAWHHRIPLAALGANDSVAVVVEDLDSGTWGTALVE